MRISIFILMALTVFTPAAFAEDKKTLPEDRNDGYLHFTRCPNIYRQDKPKERSAEDKAKYDYVLEKRADGKTYVRKVAKKQATAQASSQKKVTK